MRPSALYSTSIKFKAPTVGSGGAFLVAVRKPKTTQLRKHTHMRISQTFASKYMKAADLDGGDMLATIDRVVEEEVGKDKQSKPVLYLNGQQKGIVLNRTNAERLATRR